MAASGPNFGGLIRSLGISAGKVDVQKVTIGSLYLHPEGHALRHPRADCEIDPALVADICAHGIQEAVRVRLEFDPKGRQVLALCDGARRRAHGLAAQALLRKRKDEKLLVLGPDGAWHLPVKVQRLGGDCTDAEFLLERQRADQQGWKEDHSITVLAKTIVQMMRPEIGLRLEQVLKVLPQGWTKAHVESVAFYWHTLTAELVRRFDKDGVPVGLLPAILRTPPNDRERVLKSLLDAEVTTPAAATRLLNGFAKVAETVPLSLTTVDEGDIEDDGLGRDEDEPPAEREDEDDEPAPSSPAVTRTKSPRPPRPGGLAGRKRDLAERAMAPVQAVHPLTLKKIVSYVQAQPNISASAANFFLGAQLAAALVATNQRESVASLLPYIKGLPDPLRHLVLGECYRAGIFTPEWSGLVDGDVLALIENATMKRPAGGGAVQKVPAKKGKKQAA